VSDLNDMLQLHGPDGVRTHMDEAAARLGNSNRNGSGATPKPKRQAGMKWSDHTITAAALKHLKFPPVLFVVPGLITEGLSILAGRPKLGKSWLALKISVAVAAGLVCLGNKRPAQGDVLYCALEDNQRRLQRRMDKLVSPLGNPWPERLTLTTLWRRLDKGGVNDIALWADKVSEPRLVVIDTLAAVRPIKANIGYNEDYEALTALHRFANDRGIAVLVLHHTRKMEAEDPIDTVSGTLGLAGCADAVLVLARSSKGTTLYVRGRDIEEAEHAVVFDKATCRWSILGDVSEVRRSDERNRILTAFKQTNKKVLRPSEIAAATQMDDTNVRKLVGKMVRTGELEKDGRGKYRAPNEA
jgi:RecA-family ATPase